MPQGLDRGDRKLLIGAGVLLVVLVIASTLLAPAQSESRATVPSTYSAAWGGGKAAYLVLQGSGYQIERWEQPPTELAEKSLGQVLILAEPRQAPSADERQSLHNFLENGGRIVATGSYAAKLLPEATEFEEGFDEEDVKTFAASVPSPIMRGAPEIKMIAPQEWHPKSPAQLVVYGDAKTAAVIAYKVGRGQVIWWGAATPLTNGFIRDSSNLALLLNSVGPPTGVHVYWDEYFHGVEGGLWDYLARTPVPWGILQFALVFLAILATFARRQGPVHIPAKISRLSPLEFVETLGDLYSSGHAGSAAVRIAYQRFRFILTRQLGLAGDTAFPELARKAQASLGWNREEVYGTLAQAERLMRSLEVRDADARKIVLEIYDYTTRLDVRASRRIERPLHDQGK